MTQGDLFDYGKDGAARVPERRGRPAGAGDRCARLRALLADGLWHQASELERVGGRRFGARLHEIRRGEDGRPALPVLGQPSRIAPGDWEYRAGVAP